VAGAVYGILAMAGGEVQTTFWHKQLIFIGIGLVVMILFALFDYRIFKNYSTPVVIFYGITLLLISTSLISGSIRGIRAWISLGALRLEPSELAKLAIVILLAKYFSQKHVEIYRIHHIIVSGIYVALPAGLILLQPDLGSAAVAIIIWLGMLLAAGIKRRHLLVVIAIGMLLVVVAWFYFLAPYQKGRIVSFINPYLDPKGEGYSIIQSRIAIGSGGWRGTGWGQGGQARFGFLPEAHTDFAFAALAEQFGWIGSSTLLGLVFYLLWRVGKIGFSAGNNFAKLFTIGLMIFVFSHVLINAGMNLGVLPITGIPFPFISYGGSFLLSTAIGLGLVQSIYRRTQWYHMSENKNFKLKLKFIDQSRGELSILSERKLIASEAFSFNRDLDQLLLLTLDKLLLKNTMSLISFKTYQIMGRVSRCSLSYQIAQAVLSGLK